MPPGDLPVLGFPDSGAWESWPAGQHADSAGIWLKIPKKGSAAPGVPHADALAVALCYGWIDGQKGRIGDTRQTRAGRVAKYVAMLAAHETIHPQA
jgi:uncharacterized protein YdeI (YjbR/CyaY-like superfamily)